MKTENSARYEFVIHDGWKSFTGDSEIDVFCKMFPDFANGNASRIDTIKASLMSHGISESVESSEDAVHEFFELLENAKIASWKKHDGKIGKHWTYNTRLRKILQRKIGDNAIMAFNVTEHERIRRRLSQKKMTESLTEEQRQEREKKRQSTLKEKYGEDYLLNHMRKIGTKNKHAISLEEWAKLKPYKKSDEETIKKTSALISRKKKELIDCIDCNNGVITIRMKDGTEFKDTSIRKVCDSVFALELPKVERHHTGKRGRPRKDAQNAPECNECD